MGSNPPPPFPGPDTGRWEPPTRGPVPEILPPNGFVPPSQEIRYAPPAPPVRRRPRWSSAPATYTLLGINCAVFLLMAIKGVNPVAPSGDALMRWGADNAGYVLILGQWWRVVTAMFVHGGIMHLALNMWCLWNLGMLAEPLMGSFGVIAVYLLTGAAGNLLSILVNWIQYSSHGEFPAGVGASGAIFGIAGALIVLLKSQRLPVPPEELKKIRRSVIYFAAINLVIGFSINFGASRMGVGIDNMAHLGGCASGLLFAAPMVPRLGWPRKTFETRLRLAVAMVAGILVLFAFFLTQLAR